MSVWRRKAIDCLPDLKKEFENPGMSIYDVFIEILPAVVKANKEKDILKLEKIYGFAEWCLQQKEKDLWNAAGVSFYGHLGDYEETLNEMPKWLKQNIYVNIRDLLEVRLQKVEIQRLDNLYNYK